MTGSRTTLAPHTRRTVFAAMFASALLLPAQAPAQQRVERLERLEVSLWPEYDQPSMLVMFKGWLPADTTFPATVRLPMPAEAGAPNAVAFRGPGGTMLTAQHTFETEGDWTNVVLTTQSTEVRLEYYVALDTSQPGRYYRFLWPGGLEITQVAYDVLQPRGSNGLSVVPAGAKSPLDNGLLEERADLGAVLRGDEFTIEVSYSKPSTDLTVAPPQPAQPPAPQPTAMPVRFESPDSEPRSWLPMLLVATGAFMAGFWLGRSRKRA